VPRPTNAELLHERCFDDNDLVRLYEVAHWSELPDAVVESEYAALSFLSAAGFRHFIPAYMGFALRHLDSGAAAVESTIWSLSPEIYDDPGLGEFARSKFVLLDDRQRAAATGFLETVRTLGDEYHARDAERALAWWRT